MQKFFVFRFSAKRIRPQYKSPVIKSLQIQKLNSREKSTVIFLTNTKLIKRKQSLRPCLLCPLPALDLNLWEGSVGHVKGDATDGRLGGGPLHQRQLAEPELAEQVRLRTYDILSAQRLPDLVDENQTKCFTLLLWNFILILKILTVTRFEDPKAAFLTLKMLTGNHLWFCKIIPEAACDKLSLVHFPCSQWDDGTREHRPITKKRILRRCF